ncbi:nucleoside monophosphate kinase [archaeon]|nr:nucleoside monophosphate kinase [archaeon]
MKLIFIGPQGSGKGTQAKMIAEKFGLCHISVGDLLRKAKGKIKEEIDKVMNAGKLVPDEFVEELLLKKVSGNGCAKGYILDGYPRNVKQLDFFEKNFDVDKVFEISISDDESVRRILGRRSCSKCGAIFNVNSFPKPKVDDVCDNCGGKLIKRKDDNEGALRKRLGIYHRETERILKMHDFVKIDGEQDIEKVFEDIVKVLG